MFRKYLIGLFLSLAVCIGVTVAQAPAPAAPNLQEFDSLVNQALVDFQIPGVSVAVVQDGKVIYAKGFGYRDVEKRLPATPDTLFAIGSVSKSFTSLIFAMQNDEGKVDWDKPIRTYLPTFNMDDPIASEHATPRDLLSHRTGLPGHDVVWYSSNFSREDLFHRIQYLKSNKEFRSAYQYCNLMFMTMGYLEGQVANTTWEDLVRTRIFGPLGMRTSNFSVNDSQKAADFAQPYDLKNDAISRVPFKNIDAIGPAGSINSSVNEMARYMEFHLGDGTFEGQRLVSQANLKLVHTGQTAMTHLPEFFSQNGLGSMNYAMGWVDTSFRGHHMVWHNGGIDGFHSLLTMLPEDKIGVVLLSNLSGNVALEPIAYSIFDRLLGLHPDPWLDRYKGFRDKTKEAEAAAKKNKVSTAKPGTSPSHPLADFKGDFVHPGYGTIKIGLADENLTITINQLGPFPLKRIHYDIFQVPEEPDSIVAGVKVQFLMNREGHIDRLAVPFESTLPEDIVFTRAAEKISKEVLQTLIGDYTLEGAVVNVSLAGGTLRLTVPGQPVYELEPVHGLSFTLKGLNGYTAEFKKDASGKVTEMLFTQPEGSTVAKKN